MRDNVLDGTPSEVATGLFLTSASTLLVEGAAQADADKAEQLRRGLLAGKQLRFVTTMPPVSIAVYLVDGIDEQFLFAITDDRPGWNSWARDLLATLPQ